MGEKHLFERDSFQSKESKTPTEKCIYHLLTKSS